jgi:hypothetical protein
VKKDEVKIGETYTAKVSDKVVPVRIDKENPRGGWDATNLVTNKQVRIKSAQRLRGRVATPALAPASGKDDAKRAPKQPVKKKLSIAERRARVNQAQAKADKPTPAAKKAGAPKEKKLSLIDAAVQVLGKAKEPMGTKELVAQITEQNLWSPRSGGKTPHATLYSAILRELQKKGKDARFQKVERGRFTLAKGA